VLIVSAVCVVFESVDDSETDERISLIGAERWQHEWIFFTDRLNFPTEFPIRAAIIGASGLCWTLVSFCVSVFVLYNVAFI
jgi:hypothetical protein